MDKNRFLSYKNGALSLLIIAAAALVVCAAASALKPEPAQDVPEQSYKSYYSSNGAASQENTEAGAPIFPGSSPSSAEAAPTQGPESYLITIYSGKIGVFREGEARPFLTAEVPVYLLPDEDVAILRRGIRADSLAAVKSVLEDYD